MDQTILFCFYLSIFAFQHFQILNVFVSLQIDRDDNLPKRLCQQCYANLTHCREFFNKCKKSEETLRATLIKNDEQITVKTEEIDVPLEEDPLKGVYNVSGVQRKTQKKCKCVPNSSATQFDLCIEIQLLRRRRSVV